MSEATAAQPAPEPPGTLEELTAAQNVLLDRTERELAALRRSLGTAMMTQGELIEFTAGLRRVADVQGELRDLRIEGKKLRAFRSLEQAKEIMATQLAPVPELAPVRARHRAQRRRDPNRPLMRSVPGAVPLGVIAAKGVTWAGHHAVAAASIAAATVATTAILIPGSPVSPLGGGAAPTSAPAPAASIVAAVPITGPSQIASAVTRPKGAGPRTLSVLGPSSMPPYLPAVAPSPGGGSSQAAVPPQQPAVVYGSLTVTQVALDLTGSGTGQLTLSCAGGSCPWHVIVGGALSADVRSGTLEDGGTATVTITCDPAALVLGGNQTVTIWPGDAKVAVSWTAPPPPPPLPTDTPTDVPTDTPTVIPTS